LTTVTDAEVDNSTRVKNLQQSDTFCSPLLDYFSSGILPADATQARKIVSLSTLFTIIEGLLYFIEPAKPSENPKLVIPKGMREEILENSHDSTFAGHYGFTRTYHRIKLNYYWYTMYNDIRAYCEQCIKCLKRKPMTHKNTAPLVSIPVHGPFDRLAVDILGPLPMSENGNKYILIFSEYLSKYVEGVALPDTTAKTVARAFMEKIVLRHGAPSTLLSDRGTNFLFDLMKEICLLCGTKKINTSAYRPQTDGMVERFNRTVAVVISMFINRSHTNWDALLPYAIWSYNTSRHESTCYSPFFLLFGRAPISPTDQPFTFSPSRYIFHSDDYAHEVKSALSICWEIARQNIARAQGNQARQHNKRQHVAEIKPGDLVFQYKPATLPSLCPKFTSFWKGPYVVVQVQMPSVQIAIDDTKRSRLEWTHINMLKVAKFSNNKNAQPGTEEAGKNDEPSKVDPIRQNIGANADATQTQTKHTSNTREPTVTAVEDKTRRCANPPGHYNLRPRR